MVGRVHSKVTLALAGVTLLAPVLVQDVRALAVTAGALTALVVDPDLDLPGKTYSEHLVHRYAGQIVGLLWRVYWYPYAKLIPHRDRLSHCPILSTAIRAFYLMAPAIAVGICFDWSIPWSLLAYWFAGLSLADLLHILLDHI